MKQYRATITAGRWPYECTVQANNWHTAAHRAVMKWHSRFSGERTDEIKIRIVCVSTKKEAGSDSLNELLNLK